jgi:hypothetical protein
MHILIFLLQIEEILEIKMFWRFSYSTSQIQCLLEKEVIRFILKFYFCVYTVGIDSKVLNRVQIIRNITKVKCVLNSSQMNIINLTILMFQNKSFFMTFFITFISFTGLFINMFKYLTNPSIFKRHMKTRSSRVNNAHETRLKHVEYEGNTRLKHVEYRFKKFRLKRSL